MVYQLWTEAIFHPWTLWVFAAIVCGIMELVLPSFSSIFAAVAAMITAVVSLKFGWVIQMVVFSVVLVAEMALLRPRLLAKIHSKVKLPSRTEILIGKRGIVTETVDPLTSHGRVNVEGQDWAAQSSHSIAIGTSIIVEGSDGIILNVKEISPTE